MIKLPACHIVSGSTKAHSDHDAWHQGRDIPDPDADHGLQWHHKAWSTRGKAHNLCRMLMGDETHGDRTAIEIIEIEKW